MHAQSWTFFETVSFNCIDIYVNCTTFSLVEYPFNITNNSWRLHIFPSYFINDMKNITSVKSKTCRWTVIFSRLPSNRKFKRKTCTSIFCPLRQRSTEVHISWWYNYSDILMYLYENYMVISEGMLFLRIRTL